MHCHPLLPPVFLLSLGLASASLAANVAPSAPKNPASTTASFADFDARARAGERLSVAFLGGSLTWGAQATNPQLTSYRALTARKLEETYPAAHFRFHDAAIGGTGSQLAAFRLERDVLAHNPDLVFLDFTINDNPYAAPDPNRLAAYEALVRRMVSRGIPVVQAIFASKKDALPSPPPRPLDAAHRAIASAYGLPTGDAVAFMRDHVNAGRATPDALWDAPPDTTHPGDAGYALYAEAVWNAFSKAVADRLVCQVPARMLNADTYMAAARIRLSQLAPFPAGWTVGQPYRGAVAYDFVMSRWLDDVSIACGPEARPLRLAVRGSDVMLFGEATPASGSYEVRIDGATPATWKVTAPGGNMRYFQIIAKNLDPAVEHIIEIIPKLTDAQELRIESICVAGAPATARLAH
ncbi:SGNH/GDSL hydrolase family protein [Geminisphaera colitermitum]|uniref:SGNH/GDSL hydrolase family protein n=1 Tax=Geminisphaera colitermitum TaxID=1148786 RepID=UPI000693C9B4|nr:SGNH/GDSL hydrolase family protein [Geminisphaera colitermitum]